MIYEFFEPHNAPCFDNKSKNKIPSNFIIYYSLNVFKRNSLKERQEKNIIMLKIS